MRKTCCILLLSIIFFSCGNKQSEAEFSSKSANVVKSLEKIDSEGRKLIKDGSLRFETQNIEKTNTFIKNTVGKFGAYISEDNSDKSQSQIGCEQTIRVPAEKYDSLMNYIIKNANIKKISNKSTQIQDITEEFIDTQTRIKVKKETELKLIELVKQAKNLTEVLEIQKQLTELRTDIESIEGRLKYLNNQVGYSTLKVSYFEKVSYSKRFFGDFWDALKDGGQVFLHIITLLAYLWVIILVVILGRWGYRYYEKNRRKS